MIHLSVIHTANFPTLRVSSPGGSMTSALPDDADRLEQARLLIDAAAALLDGDAEREPTFERLHEAMDSLVEAIGG